MKAYEVESNWLRLEEKTWNVVGIKNCESLERFKINSRSVQMTILMGPMWPSDKLPRRATAYVDLKNLIWVVKIGDDQIELGKVIRQFFRQLAIAGKESSHWPRF